MVRTNGRRSVGANWHFILAIGYPLSETHKSRLVEAEKQHRLLQPALPDRISKHYGVNSMQWEYLTIENTTNADELNVLGAKGWELVAVVSPGHFVLHYFFKREVRS